jgi:hypothetical protein
VHGRPPRLATYWHNNKKKRKNRLVAARSGEATLEFEDKQQVTTRKKMNRSVAASSGEATLEFDEATQQSIESPGVGDSFSFRKRQQSATATH